MTLSRGKCEYEVKELDATKLTNEDGESKAKTGGAIHAVAALIPPRDAEHVKKRIETNTAAIFRNVLGTDVAWCRQGSRIVIKRAEQGMSRKMIIMLVGVLLCTGAVGGWWSWHLWRKPPVVQRQLEPQLSREEAQKRYEKAKALLEDPRVKDISKVPEVLRQCGEAGHREACLLLLELYCGKRKGMKADAKKAQAWVEQLKNNPRLPGDTKGKALYTFALFEEECAGRESRKMLRDKRIRNAYSNMKEAAKGYKFPKAQAEYARYLMFGAGTEKDPQKALKILNDLARHHPDTPNLFFYAGYMYYKGMGIYGGPNYEMARGLYEKGRQYRDACAINNLARMYEHGIGGPADRRTALALYQLAAALGRPYASSNVQRLSSPNRATSKPWSKRLAHATLRVIDALPLSDALREQLEAPLRESPPSTP